MPVPNTAKLFTTAAFLMFGGVALAQDTTTPATPAQTPIITQTPAPAEEASPADSLSMGKEDGAPVEAADGIGSTYVSATYVDWLERCVRMADGSDPCHMYQLLKDSDGNSVAEISIFGLPKGQKAFAGATIIVPLETLLTADLTMQIDTAAPRKYPFSWCSSIGCIARLGFTEAEVDALKKGNKAEISIVPVVAPDQKVTVNVSLKGFTAGYDAVNVSNGN